jgi:hypothetical protein
MADALWSGLWASLLSSAAAQTSSPTTGGSATIAAASECLQSSRAITDRFLEQQQQQLLLPESPEAAESGGPFQTAWNCHTLLSSPAVVATTMIGQGFSWRLKLGCLTLLDALCRQFTQDSSKAESPLFPLLVQDALACLHASSQSGHGTNGGEHSSTTTTLEQACFLSFVEESLLPDMFHDENYARVKAAFESGNVNADVQTVVQEAVQRWVSTYQEDSYTDPVVWAQRGAEVTSLKALHKEAHGESTTQFLTIRDAMRPLHALDPAFARPMPPPLLPLIGYDEDEVPLTDSEFQLVADALHAQLVWLTPINLRLMLFPDDEEDDLEATERYHEVIHLLKTKALVKPLAPNEQRTVLQMLSDKTTNDVEDDNLALRLVRESGLSPPNLPRLVEHNPLVAHECLVRILTYSPEDEKNDYLSSLIGMDMSLHTMEVVNRLATHHLGSGLPILMVEYLHLFISSCIASCENVTDRHAQNRLVRLVCVFIQSLLRNKIVDVEEVYVEVQNFCVEFSRIREAAALFKSLKEIS